MKVTRSATAVLSVAFVALMASNALAQPGGRRGPGGGGPGGPGGFGGRGGGDMTMQLLRIEPVQVELKIAPDQKAAITKLEEQAREQRPDFSGLGNIREMSDDERREAFEKMRKEREEQVAKMKQQLEEVLFPEQMERLDQLALQVRGVAALMGDDELATKLKITAAQKEKMTQVQEEQRNTIREKMRELFSAGGGDREAMQEAMQKVGEDMEKAVVAVLTTDQRSEYEKMKGKPFEMPEGAFGRGGFGGGRGGFGGGQPGGGRGRGGFGGGQRGGGQPGGRGGNRNRPPAESGN